MKQEMKQEEFRESIRDGEAEREEVKMHQEKVDKTQR